MKKKSKEREIFIKRDEAIKLDLVVGDHIVVHENSSNPIHGIVRISTKNHFEVSVAVAMGTKVIAVKIRVDAKKENGQILYSAYCPDENKYNLLPSQDPDLDKAIIGCFASNSDLDPINIFI